MLRAFLYGRLILPLSFMIPAAFKMATALPLEEVASFLNSRILRICSLVSFLVISFVRHNYHSPYGKNSINITAKAPETPHVGDKSTSYYLYHPYIFDHNQTVATHYLLTAR